MTGTASIEIHGITWAVDVATTSSELTNGLGGLASIPAYTGMLFDVGYTRTISVTTEPMLFPIDIAFISEDSMVVEVVQEYSAGQNHTCETPARYFLEVNAGEMDDVQVGDLVLMSSLGDNQTFQPSWLAGVLRVALTALVVVQTGMEAWKSLKPDQDKPGQGKSNRAR